MAAPLELAPYRQDKKIFPTPIVGDVLFSEFRDCTRVDIPEYGTPHPNAKKWPDHKLVFVAEANSEREGVFRFFYAADRDAQDSYNFEYTKADIGGTKFDAVARTYVIPRSEFEPDTPDAGSLMPDVPAGKFVGDYVLTDSIEQRIGDRELDSLYVVVRRVYTKRTVLVQCEYDEAFGGVMQTKQTLYYHNEVVLTVDETDYTAEELFADIEDNATGYWGMQTGGFEREGKQLSSNWYAVTERYVVPKWMADTEGAGRSYYTTTDFSWPAVLSTVDWDIWDLRDGGSDYQATPVYLREAYRGPCRALVKEWFYSKLDDATDAVTVPEVLEPLPIVLTTPFFAIHIPACLHGDASFTPSFNDHPKYEDVNGNWTFLATSPDDWPPQLVVSDELRPFRGGYLRTQITVYPPNTTA